MNIKSYYLLLGIVLCLILGIGLSTAMEFKYWVFSIAFAAFLFWCKDLIIRGRASSNADVPLLQLPKSGFEYCILDEASSVDLNHIRAYLRLKALKKLGSSPETKLEWMTKTQDEESVKKITLDQLEQMSCSEKQYSRSHYGILSYPIAAESEHWLMDQLSNQNSELCRICADALHDFNWDGVKVGAWRSQGMFELPTALTISGPEGQKISSDSLFEAIMTIGPTLSAQHCAIWLSWFGILEIDGKKIENRDELTAFLKLAQGERRRRTRLVTPQANGPTGQIKELMSAFYQAWIEDQRIQVWA